MGTPARALAEKRIAILVEEDFEDRELSARLRCSALPGPK